MQETNYHIALAKSVAATLTGHPFKYFAAFAAQMYGYRGWTRDCNEMEYTLFVSCSDDEYECIRALEDPIQELGEEVKYNLETIFSGTCGDPDSVETLEELFERDPWLRGDFDLDYEDDEEEENVEEEEEEEEEDEESEK